MAHKTRMRYDNSPIYKNSILDQILGTQEFSGAFNKDIYNLTGQLYKNSENDVRNEVTYEVEKLVKGIKQLPKTWVQTMLGITVLLYDRYDDQDVEMILEKALSYVSKKDNCKSFTGDLPTLVNDAIQVIARLFGSGDSEIDGLVFKADIYKSW